MPLTDTQVKKAQAATGKRVRLYDERGLYLELPPAGGRWWRFKYRFDGREKLLSLGTYPDTGLKDARDKRDAARKLLAEGKDPGAARKAEKAAKAAAAITTLESVARAWLKKQAGAWKPNTLAAIQASLKTHVFEQYGKRPAKDIQPKDIREIVLAIEASGAVDVAGRVFQRLRAVYRYAIAHDLVAVDPTYPLKPAEIFKPRDVKHRAALAESDVPLFLRQLDAYDGDPTTKAALTMLMLTAVRPGELRGARWDEIDEERALWKIAPGRMKMGTQHLVPLSRQALEVLELMRPLSGGRELVFPSPFYPGKSLSENTLNSALARLGYKGIATAHGMRTLFSTCANEACWSGDIIERQLAHEERNNVRAAYKRAQHLPERTKILQWWADRLDVLRQGAGVIPIRARKASPL